MFHSVFTLFSDVDVLRGMAARALGSLWGVSLAPIGAFSGALGVPWESPECALGPWWRPEDGLERS